MRVKDLINELMNNCNSVNDNVVLYVCGKTIEIERYVNDAKSGEVEWCLDEKLEIREVEDHFGSTWIKAEEIRW